MNKFSILSVIIISSIVLSTKAQTISETTFYQIDTTIINQGVNLPATILIPDDVPSPPVVLIIPGSGPTDKDGNNSMMKNNHMKMLAEELAKLGIGSLRYDKRIIPGNNAINESELQFNDLILDAGFCYNFLKESKRFGDIYISGISQGSLIGMILAQSENPAGFISINGPGEPISTALIRQISEQNDYLGEQAVVIVDSLLMGYDVKKITPMLYGLFRPSVQPFLRGWMGYDPCTEIAKLTCKILIIQGTSDIQVKITDAEKLHTSSSGSELKFINEMNHILKNSPTDRTENLKTYSDPDLEINPVLVQVIKTFVNKQ